MSEYIDREAVLKAYEEEQKRPGTYRFENIINSVHASDVVPVVRCGECARTEESEHENCVICIEHNKTMRNDDFCSYGERKETDESQT